MPDWTYRTLLRPVLFRLPAGAARRWTLEALGRLAALPGGYRVVEFFGHMRADRRLAVRVASRDFPAPAGLGSALDGEGTALGALARFGVGFVELGPVGTEAQPVGARLEPLGETWTMSASPVITPARLARRLARARDPGVPFLARLAGCLVCVAEALPAALRERSPHVAGFVL